MRGPVSVLSLVCVVGCAHGTADAGPPVASEALCGEVVRIVCDGDEACCGSDVDDCEATQTELCEASLGALVADPRVAYVPTRGGRLLAQLEAQASHCGEEPLRWEQLTDLFAGTGEPGADCTPRQTTGTVDASDMLRAQLSCGEGTTCRLALDVAEDPHGTCEAREASDPARCSHRYDCEAGTWCNLRADWLPGEWGDCQPLRTDGWPCESDVECESGACADGVCGARPAIDRCLTAAYPDLVLASEPIAYFRLGDRGRSAVDAAADQNGSYVDPVTHATTGAIEDDHDGALALAGMGGHVEVPSLEGLTADGALTIELWIQKAEAGGGPLLELVSHDGAALRLHLDGGRVTLALLGQDDDAATEVATPADAIGAGFHHVAFTIAEESTRLFVDGVEVATLAGARQIPVDAQLLIGFHDAAEAAMQTSLTGTVDELAVYAAVLPPAVLLRHVRAGRTGSIANDFVLFVWAR